LWPAAGGLNCACLLTTFSAIAAVTEWGNGPASYVNRYRHAWPAAAANILAAIDDAKRRRHRGGIWVPTGTCGRLVVTELPAPLTVVKFGWAAPPVNVLQCSCMVGMQRDKVGTRDAYALAVMAALLLLWSPVLQGRLPARLTLRCGKCKTCLRPTLRQPCLAPVPRSTDEGEPLAVQAESAKWVIRCLSTTLVNGSYDVPLWLAHHAGEGSPA
jgi:hypothetical protein